jgi:hypothetical protein
MSTGESADLAGPGGEIPLVLGLPQKIPKSLPKMKEIVDVKMLRE